jgi:hypothetical protein
MDDDTTSNAPSATGTRPPSGHSTRPASTDLPPIELKLPFDDNGENGAPQHVYSQWCANHHPFYLIYCVWFVNRQR